MLLELILLQDREHVICMLQLLVLIILDRWDALLYIYLYVDVYIEMFAVIIVVVARSF